MHEQHDITTAAGRRANSEARQAAREAEHDPAYEIILNGDRAEADTIGGALLAARTLAEDQANGIYGAARLIRRDVIITRDGTYDGRATREARDGR